MLKIHQLKLRLSNAYVIVGRRPILVDTGTAKDGQAIRTGLAKLRIELSELALIVHTHIHSDHMGSTAELASEAKCPIAYHAGDQGIIDQGHNGRLNGIGIQGKILSRLFQNTKLDRIQADVSLVNGLRLDEFGCDACVLETPGHTAGSISLITPAGDAIIGDVIMGGYLGGWLFPSKPGYHYFAEDLAQAMSSLDTILTKTAGTLYVGHGGPLAHQDVERWRRQSRVS